METGDGGRDWQIRLHITQTMCKAFVVAQVNKFKGKWDHIRPDVAVEWSDKYHRRGVMVCMHKFRRWHTKTWSRH
eukprot:6209450-Prorocentrum_lima.AAC.1